MQLSMKPGTSLTLFKILMVITMMDIPGFIIAQNNRHWVFTYPRNTPPHFGGSTMRFEQDSVVISPFLSSIGSCSTNTSISDSLGNLLFYSNGCEVFGSNHQQIIGGDGLGGPRGAIDRKCMGSINTNFRQGILSLQVPGSAHSFYIFYLNLYEPNNLDKRELLCAHVEFPNGFSEPAIVTEKNRLITESFMLSIAAIRHANGQDWWLIATQEDGKLDAWLVDRAGISSSPIVSDFGDFQGEATIFSPDGKWFVQMGGYRIRLLCFNRCTGLFSCEQIVNPNIETSAAVYGVAFSASSRFLYVCDRDEVHQLDLHERKLRYTKIATLDSFTFQGFPVNFYRPQLGPDGKIYINNSNGSLYLHVIESPDSLGMACNLRQRAVQLPNLHQGQMPYFAVDLGPQPYSACDTLPSQNVYGGSAAPPSSGFEIIPNPVLDKAFISVSGCSYGLVRVFDALGREVTSLRSFYRGGQQELDCTQLASGVYRAVLSQNKRDVLSIPFVKL
jgi:hypothetical protein